MSPPDLGPFDWQPYRPSWRRRPRRLGLDPVVWRGIAHALALMLASGALIWLTWMMIDAAVRAV